MEKKKSRWKEAVSLLSRVEHKPLAEEVSQKIRNAIVQGELPSGSRLVELVLANSLGVSRATVRHALAELEHEGLVMKQWHKGTFVAEHTEQSIGELYSLRSLLEGEAAALSAQRVREMDSSAITASLEETVEKTLRLSRDTDLETLVELDLQFHEMLCELSGNSLLLELWQSLKSRTRALIVASQLFHLRPSEVAARHEAVLGAVRSGKADEARALMTQHLKEAGESVARRLSMSPGARPRSPQRGRDRVLG